MMMGISDMYAGLHIGLRTYIERVWDIAQGVCSKKRK